MIYYQGIYITLFENLLLMVVYYRQCEIEFEAPKEKQQFSDFVNLRWEDDLEDFQQGQEEETLFSTSFSAFRRSVSPPLCSVSPPLRSVSPLSFSASPLPRTSNYVLARPQVRKKRTSIIWSRNGGNKRAKK